MSQMSVAAALHASAALLLVVAGTTKLAKSAESTSELLGFKVPALLARLAGAAELILGTAALLFGGVFVWAVAVSYTVFGVLVAQGVLSRARSCGCFGGLDAPPSWVHVGVNLAFAAASFAAAAVAAGSGSGPFASVIAEFSNNAWFGFALSIEIIVIAGLGLVALTALPEALTARPDNAETALFSAVVPPPQSPPPPRR